MAKMKKVTFKFRPLGTAREVKLCGSFTGWEQGAIVMTAGKAGEWQAQVNLEPGEYEYKFLTDSGWFEDPAADHQVRNGQGSQNSVRVVR